MPDVNIGEVAAKSNLPASTIRYYEQIGVLPQTEQRNGKRLYGSEVLESLEAIKLGKGLGFTLEEIRTLFDAFRSVRESSIVCRNLAASKLRDLDELINNATSAKTMLTHGLSCRCTSLLSCYLAGAPQSSS